MCISVRSLRPVNAIRLLNSLPDIGLPALQARCIQSQTSNQRVPVAQRIQKVITPQVCAELVARGYAVVDGVFGPILSHQLQLELTRVHQSGLMHLNHTHLVNKGQTHLLPKSQIQEAELTFDPSVRQAAPLVAQLNDDRSLCTMLSLFIPQLRLEEQAIKLQYNEGGGGCFPMHFDSDEQLDMRRVTAIFYLNENWKPGHGGQLRLYPFPAPPVDIPPVADRLVLFSTTRMLHRVLPSTVPRSCFTIWLSQARTHAGPAAAATAAPAPATGQPGNDMWRFLMQPAVRQHVCKLAYEGEWSRSLRESHPSSSDTDTALLKHHEEVATICKALSSCQPALRLLLDAAATVQQAAAADTTAQGVGNSHVIVDEGSGVVQGGSPVTKQQLEQAYDVLRQIAGHVRWF